MKYFREHLVALLPENFYNPQDLYHRKILAFVYIPVVQKEYDIFVENWNSHRIRKQKDLHLLTSILDHMFSFPESYGGNKDGFQVSIILLREVTEVSELLQENQDFLDIPLSTRLPDFIPHPEELKPTEIMNAFLYLKERLCF